jgi:hypothetical protein
MMRITIKILLTLIISGTQLLLHAQSVQIKNRSFESIQAAIDAAKKGDIIEIRGVHKESLKLQKQLTLRGQDPTQDKILGTGGPVVTSVGKYGAANITIENLTIANGKSLGDPGGGISFKGVKGESVLRNLYIEDNVTDKSGGGIFISGAKVRIENCLIQRNYAVAFGAGLALMSGNVADSDVKISNTVISSNTSDDNGGAIFVNGNPKWGDEKRIKVLIENSIISYNTSKNKVGGIFVKGAAHLSNAKTNVHLVLNHNTVAYNRSLADKGRTPGIAFYGEEDAMPEFSITNSLVVFNGENQEADINFSKSTVLLNEGNIYSKIQGAEANGVDMSKSYVYQQADLIGLASEFTMKPGEMPVLKLSAESKAVDAANNKHKLPMDINGKKREKADIGAVEF